MSTISATTPRSGAGPAVLTAAAVRTVQARVTAFAGTGVITRSLTSYHR